MKALLLYSHASGHRKVKESIEFVKEKLSAVFDVLDVICTVSKEDAFALEKEAGEKYDVLLISGGDGTFNNAINAVMESDKRPILGYLNFGTIGDVGKIFGIKGGLKEAVEIIASGHYAPFDIGKVTSKEASMYFAYSATFGAYSDIAYKVDRHRKRRLGKLAYYEEAVSQAFKKQVHAYKYKGNKELVGECPFGMALLGTHIGGFKVNPHAVMDDGKMEIYLTDAGLFNGLIHYAGQGKKPTDITDRCQIELEEDLAWCLDGEVGPRGSAKIEIVPKPLQIYCQEK